MEENNSNNRPRSFMENLDLIYANDELWEKYQEIVRKEFPNKREDFFAYHRDEETKEIWAGLLENMGGGVPLSFYREVAELE